MAKKTCAACDYPLEPASTIKVKIGGKTVEVCCEECATKLREAPGLLAVQGVTSATARGAQNGKKSRFTAGSAFGRLPAQGRYVHWPRRERTIKIGDR
jgi:hypothetical protein